MIKPEKTDLPTIDLSSASVELPTDDIPPPSQDALVIAGMAATIDRLNHQIAMLTEPVGSNWQLFKNAVTDSGTPATTLRRRIESQDGKPPLVKSRVDEHGNLLVEVNDALRVRFGQAPLGG